MNTCIYGGHGKDKKLLRLRLRGGVKEIGIVAENKDEQTNANDDRNHARIGEMVDLIEDNKMDMVRKKNKTGNKEIPLHNNKEDHDMKDSLALALL